MRHTAAVQPDETPGPSLEKELAEEERRRNQSTPGDAVGTVDAADTAAGCGGCDTPNCDTPNCDGPSCDGCGGCDLLLFVRLSSLLLVAAAVLPETGGRAVVRMLLWGYRRWLTRFTPACPSTPSCSAYAWEAVESFGVRRGLAATARRVRSCRW
jgi:hypothetical protein